MNTTISERGFQTKPKGPPLLIVFSPYSKIKNMTNLLLNRNETKVDGFEHFNINVRIKRCLKNQVQIQGIARRTQISSRGRLLGFWP